MEKTIIHKDFKNLILLSLLCSITVGVFVHWLNLYFFPQRWRNMLEKNLPRYKHLIYSISDIYNIDVEKLILRDDLDQEIFSENIEGKITLIDNQHPLENDFFVDSKSNSLKRLSSLINNISQNDVGHFIEEKKEGDKIQILLKKRCLIYGVNAHFIYENIFNFDGIIKPLQILIIKPLIMNEQFKAFVQKFDPEKIIIDLSVISEKEQEKIFFDSGLRVHNMN